MKTMPHRSARIRRLADSRFKTEKHDVYLRVTNSGTSLLRIARRGGSDEFLEAQITPKRIEHWIEPEQRRRERLSYCATVRYRK